MRLHCEIKRSTRVSPRSGFVQHVIRPEPIATLEIHMTVWDLEEARALVRTRYGREQFELARQSMGSTIDRREYARYHYHEAMRLLDERVGKLYSSASLVDIMLGCDDEDEQDEFHQCISEIGAHVTAVSVPQSPS